MERVLKHFALKSFVLLSILVLGQSAFATTVVIPSDDDLVVGARAIVRAKVVSIESAFDDQHRIFTYVTLKVQEVFKGELTERRVVLKEMGGQVGDEGFRVFGNPQFTRGEKVLLYLDTWPDGSLRTHQMFLGKFSIVQDEKTGDRFVVRGAPDENVTVLANTQPSAPSTDRMELGAYVEMLRKNLSVNAERSQNFQETYYRNAPLLTRPAEYTGIAGRGEIHLEWTYISTAHPRWFEPDSGQAVVFMVNPDQAPNPQISDDIVAAMNAWSTIPGCSMQLQNGGTTGACGPSVGLNTIIFNNCDGRWSPSACAGVLALGGLGWNGNSRVVNGVTFLQAQGGFISFNPYAACNFANHCNVREVTTHELGHTLGLGHSADSSATMYAIAHFDGRCASLRQDDKDGVIFIYPGAGGGPGPLNIVTSSLPAGTVGTPYSQSLVASGGTQPYSWSLVQGQGTLPPGLSLSLGGSITGTPTTTGTYNFTANVTDAASASAQKALSIVVASAGGGLDSQFVSQTVPTTLQPGQSFDVNMKFLNIGSQTWSGSQFYLVSQNPPYNQTWGGYYLPLSSFVVSPGQQLDVTFTVYAPLTPATYNFQWQMFKDDGTTFFGQMSTNILINVSSSPPTGPSTIGIYKPAYGGFFLRNSNSVGSADMVFSYGPASAGWIPLVGDWNGDGVDTVGLYVPASGMFYLRNSNSTGSADVAFTYGPAGAGWIPIAGDWDGDGVDTIGLYNPANGAFYLRNSNSTGIADVTFTYGPANAGWTPVVGDWNGDGVDTVGLYVPASGMFYLRNSNSTGSADVAFTYGPAGAGWVPIVGDWNGDGIDTIGLYYPAGAMFFLRNSNSVGNADVTFGYGVAGDQPIAGRWN